MNSPHFFVPDFWIAFIKYWIQRLILIIIPRLIKNLVLLLLAKIIYILNQIDFFFTTCVGQVVYLFRKIFEDFLYFVITNRFLLYFFLHFFLPFYHFIFLKLKKKYKRTIFAIKYNKKYFLKKKKKKKKNISINNIFYFNFFFLKHKYYSFFKNFYYQHKIIVKQKQLHIQIYNNVTYNKILGYFFYGFKYLWKLYCYWVLSILLFFIIFYYFLVIRSLPFTKIIFEYFLFTMFFYWFISGFVFFFKKYRVAKFTSVIQRFWKRSFMLFWALEFFLFFIFFYLIINSNQEPVYMYDNLQIYKTHLFSWKIFLFKIFPIVLLIIFSFFFLLTLKWNIFSKNNLFFFFITLLLLYIVWLEFYQFYHVLSYYGNLFWIYDSDEHLWVLESETTRTRIVNHYVTIAIIAKFWHIIFVVVFWIFFLLRCNEILRYKYFFFSANLQNFILLYILSWIYMYPWLKFLLRRYMSIMYYWFYTNTNIFFFRAFFYDLKLLIFAFFTKITFFWQVTYFYTTDFSYFIVSGKFTSYCQYRKSFLKDILISNFI